jgi:hypothetical protein
MTLFLQTDQAGCGAMDLSEQLEQNSSNRSVKKDEKRYFAAAVLARVAW